MEGYKIVSLVNDFMKYKNIKCDTKRDIYFDYFPSFDAQSYDRMLFSFCNLSAKETTSACSNFYEYSGAVR